MKRGSSECKLAKILSIDDLYTIETGKFMFSLKHKSVPQCFYDLFKLNNEVHSVSTRNSNSFFLPFYSKTLTQQSIQFSGVKVWNSLPKAITNIETLSLFSSKLKSHLMDHS